MTIRYVRSPYIIDIDEPLQVGSKLELFIWNKGQTQPTTPTYNFSKSIMSTTQTLHSYNVANYVREYITNIAPDSQGSTPTQEYDDMWCYFMVKRYKLIGSTYTLLTSDTQLDSVIQIGVNGFSEYMEGRNKQSQASPKLLFNSNIKLTYTPNQVPYYVNFLTDQVNQLHTITYKDKNANVLFTTTWMPTSVSNYRISIGLFAQSAASITIDIAEPTTTTSTTTTTIPGTTTTTTTSTTTTSTTTTSTTTATPLCYSYVYGPGYTSGTIYWTNCDGSPGSAYVNSGSTYNVTCMQQGTGTGFGNWSQGSAC